MTTGGCFSSQRHQPETDTLPCTVPAPAWQIPTAGFTLATYTHATNKVQEQAAAKMGNLLKQAIQGIKIEGIQTDALDLLINR